MQHEKKQQEVPHTGITVQDIKVPGESGWLEGYFARPTSGGLFPGVVVIHEIFGLNDNIKYITQRFAAEGYAALAVDLFSRRNRALCMARLLSGMFLNSLHHQAIQDLKASLTYLAKYPVDSHRLGAIGFCMGGSFAIAWACTDKRLKVVAPFYSMNPRPLKALERCCPVVGSFPGEDFTAGHGYKLNLFLEDNGIPHDIKIYPGAKHSFFNEQGRNYQSEAAKDAWDRTLAYFRRHIG